MGDLNKYASDEQKALREKNLQEYAADLKKWQQGQAPILDSIQASGSPSVWSQVGSLPRRGWNEANVDISEGRVFDGVMGADATKNEDMRDQALQSAKANALKNYQAQQQWNQQQHRPGQTFQPQPIWPLMQKP